MEFLTQYEATFKSYCSLRSIRAHCWLHYEARVRRRRGSVNPEYRVNRSDNATLGYDANCYLATVSILYFIPFLSLAMSHPPCRRSIVSRSSRRVSRLPASSSYVESNELLQGSYISNTSACNPMSNGLDILELFDGSMLGRC